MPVTTTGVYLAGLPPLLEWSLRSTGAFQGMRPRTYKVTSFPMLWEVPAISPLPFSGSLGGGIFFKTNLAS